MPFNIRSTTDFSAGQLVLTSHATSVAADGFVEVRMDFACLATSLRTNLARFRMENSLPVALPQDVAALPLETGTLYLNSLTSSTSVGIGYIQTVYVGCSLDQKKRPVQVLAQRSFSGLQQFRQQITSGATAGARTIVLPIQFDYTAESLTVAWSAIQDTPAPILTPKITDVRNIEGGADIVQSNNTSASPVGQAYKVKFIEDSTITPVGPVKRYVKTVTATAESNFQNLR